MPRYEWQTTRTGGRRYVRIENGPISQAVPKAVLAEVAVPNAAMIIEPPDPPVVAAVELDPVPSPVVSDAEIKVTKPKTTRRRTTKKKSDG